jgi:hypothetical protein
MDIENVPSKQIGDDHAGSMPMGARKKMTIK